MAYHVHRRNCSNYDSFTYLRTYRKWRNVVLAICADKITGPEPVEPEDVGTESAAELRR